MKFTTSKEKLFIALNDAGKVLPIRTTLPILSCLLIETKKNTVLITGTDLEQTIIIEIEAKVVSEGSIALPGTRILEIVNALPSGEIEISSNEDKEVVINSTRGRYIITGKEPEEFPEAPQLQQEQELNIDGKELLKIINSTAYAVSKDDLKPALCGLYLNIEKERLTAVATDGHRLVKIRKKPTTTNPEGSIIIPVKFLNILKNSIKENQKNPLNIGKNHIDVKIEKKTIITRIIKESFPDFNSVIPEGLNIKATVETAPLISAIKRVAIFSNRITKQVILTFDKNEVVVSTEDKETKSSGKEHVPCTYKNDPISIGYNAQYVKEVLQHLNVNEVEILLSGPLTAAIFQPKEKKETEEETVLLMPLRIQT